MAGYTRQSIASIINGEDITAPPLNDEFNRLADAFNASTGHAHDGTSGNAPKIDLTTSVTGYLPAVHGGIGGKNNFAATTNPLATDDSVDGYAPGSMWENVNTGRVFICVGNTANAAVWRELVQVISSNKIEPIAHDTIDLGTPSVRFQDLYLSGGISASGNAAIGGTLAVSGATTLSSTLQVAGTTLLNGNVTLGDADTDNITFSGEVISAITPSTTNSYDLGTATKEWRNLFLDGTAHIDTLDVDDNASITGTLGVTGATSLGNLSVSGTLGVTGTTTFGTATGSNLTASGTINFAGATVSNLGTVTTAAIGGGTINNTVIGGSNAAAITGTTITANTGFTGPLTGDVTGDVSGNITAPTPVSPATSVSTFYDVTVNNSLDMTSGTISNLADPSSDDQAANKGYIDTQITNLIGGAPAALDTLNELAAAINDDENVYTNLTTSIATKLPLAGGTMTGAISMGTNKITNLATPTAASDAVTKQYADDIETQAQSYANDAANSAQAAANSYDSFDDRYLGSKASDPTLDNDSQALITGALYFNSTNGVMKVYNGSEWVNTASSIEGIKSNLYYTATAGQTVFSGADDNSNTLTVDQVNLVNVFMNGVRLHEDDYTVSSASNSVTLGSGATAGDLIYLEVFGNFAGQSGAAVNITGGSISGLTSLSVEGEVDISAPNARINLYETDTTDTNTQLQSSNSRFMIKTLSDDGATTTERLRVDHSTGDISFYDTSGNDNFYWDASSGTLGIGTDVPNTDSQLNVVSAAGVGSLRIDGATNTKITNVAANTGSNIIYFGDSDSFQAGMLRYTHSDDLMTLKSTDSINFLTNNVERVRIDDSGLIVTGTIKLDGNHPTSTGNVGLGNNALDALTTGLNNTAVGSYALPVVTTGNNNVAVGQQSLYSNTTGHRNTAVGTVALQSNTTGTDNTAVGWTALQDATTASNNTAVGRASLSSITTGTSNSAVGYGSLSSLTTGINNVAIGLQAGNSMAAGSYNSLIGAGAGFNLTSGIHNVAIGNLAGNSQTTADYNVFVGRRSGYNLTTGSQNTYIGTDTGFATTTGTQNTALGYQAFNLNSTGDNNTVVGHSALASNQTAYANDAFGKNALTGNTTGEKNVSIGAFSSQANTTGSYNVAVGHQALRDNTTGGITAVGYQSGISNTTGTRLTALGYNSAVSNSTGGYNTALGYQALRENETGNSNVAVGENSMYYNTGSENTAVGRQSLISNTSGVSNTAVGYQAGYSVTTNSETTSVGWKAGYSNTSAKTQAFGAMALHYNTTGGNNTAVGWKAGYNNTTGTQSTFLGESAGVDNTTGYNNTFVGSAAGYKNTTGYDNVVVGRYAFGSNLTGHSSTVVGFEALNNATSQTGQNIALGRKSGYSLTTAGYNVLLGNNAGYFGTTAARNTMVGFNAGYQITTGSRNTIVGANDSAGYGAGYYMTTGTANTILGAFDGNQDGVDIRTASNNIVLSDGDGNARFRIDASGNGYLRATAPQFNVTTTTTSGNDAVIRISGARTSSSTSNIATVRFANQTTSPYNMAEIVARDPAGAHLNGRGRLVFRTSSGGTLADHMSIDYQGAKYFYGDNEAPAVNNQTGTSIKADGSMQISGNHVGLIINRISTTGHGMQFRQAGSVVGSIQINASSAAYNTSSDYRLKENVVDLTGATERLKQIPVHRFNFIAEPDTTVDGFLAHEVSDIVPEAITGAKDAMMDEEYEVTPEVRDDEGNLVSEAVMGTRSVPDYQAIDQSKLVPLLTAALQEAITKIEQLEARVATLEG